ncbi:hypothetical protein HOY80DRAFT_651783 [Tuber brumale]|nr:hypothetical protein HOY80DRAFT_651783 [Tuber brumale]
MHCSDGQFGDKSAPIMIIIIAIIIIIIIFPSTLSLHPFSLFLLLHSKASWFLPVVADTSIHQAANPNGVRYCHGNSQSLGYHGLAGVVCSTFFFLKRGKKEKEKRERKREREKERERERERFNPQKTPDRRRLTFHLSRFPSVPHVPWEAESWGLSGPLFFSRKLFSKMNFGREPHAR